METEHKQMMNLHKETQNFHYTNYYKDAKWVRAHKETDQEKAQTPADMKQTWNRYPLSKKPEASVAVRRKCRCSLHHLGESAFYHLCSRSAQHRVQWLRHISHISWNIMSLYYGTIVHWRKQWIKVFALSFSFPLSEKSRICKRSFSRLWESPTLNLTLVLSYLNKLFSAFFWRVLNSLVCRNSLLLTFRL